jgi:hypothetical protein
MSSLSVVVPRLGTDVLFENTLASILRYRMPHHQVVVVQSDLQADTWGLQEEVEFVEVSGRPSLARYFNHMLDAVTGDVVNVIRPGVEVTHQWFAQGVRYLQSRTIGAVACSLVAAQYRDELISCGLLANRAMLPVHATDPRQRPVGPSSWAGLYRRELLQALGPFDESISDELFALDLALSLRGLGAGCGVLTDRVLTLAAAELLQIAARPQTGRDAQRLIQRHLAGESQRLGSLVAFGSDCLGCFWRPAQWSRLAGRFAARSKQATDRAFHRRLAIARHELAEQGNAIERGRAA